MNGLLHRMAARAAGTAVAVRSDAGLPYAAGAAGSGAVDPAQSHLVTGAQALAPLPPASAPHRHEPVTWRADQPLAADSARTPSPLVVGLNDADPMRATPQSPPNASFAPRVDSTRASNADEPQSTMSPLHVAPLMPRTVPAALERAGEAACGPREIVTTARTAARDDEPEPLMPRQPRSTPLAPIPQPSSRRGALQQDIAATQSEADAEVHIHIGRIDVTAVHEAAPPRRRAAAAPAPMSLDGYLAQRGRS